ncbi:MAG TPA: hypothetical protein VMC86_04265 [Gemmatimonadales bacterium]|nr:hypothetical protein [Gemmatimonadales bacterium]
MSRRAIALAALLVVPAGLGAQVAVNRSTTYLMPSDVQDARAIWVNPAGLGVQSQASIYFDLTASDPGSRAQLRQLNLGFNARGLSFAYQRDQFSGGTRGSTYKMGFGVGEGRLAVGAAAALYRGDTKGTGWDLGASFKAAHPLVLALVVGNIGQPSVRGVEQRIRYTASGTLQVAPGFGVAALAAADPRGMQAYGLAAHAGFDWSFPVALVARLDTDQKFRRQQFALGISIGGTNQLGVIATAPGDISSVNDLTVVGVATRTAPARR